MLKISIVLADREITRGASEAALLRIEEVALGWVTKRFALLQQLVVFIVYHYLPSLQQWRQNELATPHLIVTVEESSDVHSECGKGYRGDGSVHSVLN